MTDAVGMEATVRRLYLIEQLLHSLIQANTKLKGGVSAKVK